MKKQNQHKSVDTPMGGEKMHTVPVPTVWSTQEEVLENDYDPVPKHYFASENRFVE